MGFRAKICGHADERPYDVSLYEKRPNPALVELGGVRLALGEKEELLLELFPSVAEKFLKNKRRAEWDAAHPPEPPEPERPSRYPDELWEGLSLQAGASA